MSTTVATPYGYSQVFANQNASLSASAYMGLYTLNSYDVPGCQSICDQNSGCVAFNMYAERDPTVNPDPSQCPNPASTTNYKVCDVPRLKKYETHICSVLSGAHLCLRNKQITSVNGALLSKLLLLHRMHTTKTHLHLPSLALPILLAWEVPPMLPWTPMAKILLWAASSSPFRSSRASPSSPVPAPVQHRPLTTKLILTRMAAL